MSFSRFNKFKDLYTSIMPFIAIYSTFMGMNTGITINHMKPNNKPFEVYSNIIGYTSLGIITGITYPISYPLFGCYVLYKNKNKNNNN